MKIKLLILLIFIFLTGCTSSIDTSFSTALEDNDTIDKEPTEGGSITLSMRAPKTLNPLLNEDYTVDNILKLIFEPLFTIDENFNPIPNLASSYSLSEDGLTLTINMRTDIYWHDGASITAEDVIFSLDVIKDNPSSIYYNVLNKISSYSQSGNSVIINYTEPYALYLYNLCFPIIPKHYYKNNLSSDSDASFSPIGSGVYKFSSYRLANNLTLEKVTTYKGTPYIDTINVIFTPDRETDLSAFETNITDSLTVNFDELSTLNFNREKVSYTFTTNNFEFLGFNNTKDIFQNIYLKKAIAYAIPKDSIIQSIMLDNGIKSTSPINPIYTNSSDYYEYDTTKAIDNLALANLTETSFSILVNSENEVRLEIAEIIKSNLEQLGLNITIVSKPFDEYIELLTNDDFDMFLGGINFGLTPDFESFISSSGIEEGVNYFNYSNEQMDNLLKTMLTATNEQDFLKGINDFETFFYEQLPFVGLFFKENILVTDASILGNKYPTIYNQFNNIELWYINND